LAQAGLKSNCGGPEAVTAKLEVCLPHGCCHLFCDSVMGSAGAVSMDGRAVTTSGPVKAIDHSDQFWHRLRNDAFPPVMSYFEPSKFTTSGANFIEEQRARLKTLIAEAPSIAVIGIQVREQDAHIWNALASTKAPIYYCSGERGGGTYKTWSETNRPNAPSNEVISTGHWDTNFDQICVHVGMN
jgi:hypothetical protein